MRVLVTGGFGFLGGRIAKYLTACGHNIVLGSRRKVAPPEWLPEAEVIQTDWNSARSIDSACFRVDAVVHAAGMNAGDCMRDRIGALECNGVGTATLVESAIRNELRGIVYVSTAHVYARPLVGVIRETDCPRNLHPYATSHVAGENVVLEANDSGRIDGLVLRLSNAFGAPMSADANCWELLMNDLCKQVAETGKMRLNSDGRKLRDFVSIDEVARTIEHLLNTNSSESVDVLNVGSGQSRQVGEMAEMIQARAMAIYGQKPDLEIGAVCDKPLPAILEYRIDKLNAIGVHPKTNVEKEIDDLLRFCNKNFGDSSSIKGSNE